jgi:hypothetical protein
VPIPATLQPFEDQWAFLSSLGRSSAESISSLAESVRLVAAGPDERTYREPHGGDAPKPPEVILAEVGPMLSVDRIGMPPALLAALKHQASLHNPAYYEASGPSGSHARQASCQCGVASANSFRSRRTPAQEGGWLPPGGGPSTSMPNSGASAIHPATSGGIVGSRRSDAGTPTRS